MIIYMLDTQGGFTCGDTVTENTAYAYPTSVHATKAKRDPYGVAAEMLRQANYINPLLPADIVRPANVRNWNRLNGCDEAVRRLSHLLFAQA